MLMKFPKDDSEFAWTSHSKSKMLQYRLSPQIIKTILKNPERTESGIAPRTLAVMQRKASLKRKEEMWVMYQTEGSGKKLNITNDRFNIFKRSAKKKIISVWRYPGVSPKRMVPLPEGLLEELEKGSDE